MVASGLKEELERRRAEAKSLQRRLAKCTDRRLRRAYRLKELTIGVRGKPGIIPALENKIKGAEEEEAFHQSLRRNRPYFVD